MAGAGIGRVALIAGLVAGLAGCKAGEGPFAKKPEAGVSAPAEEATAGVAPATSVKLVDRDVEAPEVFQVTDTALWDGRPSLGGVWVASPDATDPERVILRNPANGKFVIGALFRRERDNPGPALQISSDAATALGLLAGQPGQLNVTALRREEAPEATPDVTKPILDAAEAVETASLETAAVAGAAIDKADRRKKRKAEANQPALQTAPEPQGAVVTAALPAPGAEAAPQPAPAANPVPAAKPATSGGLIQVGIFSVEANAKRAVDTLAKAGITADLRREESSGKAFWSVTTRGDASALAKVKSAGFTDAYALKR
ncbi:MAG: SPOR domain-containing protein [Paracoccaceae bacterium]